MNEWPDAGPDRRAAVLPDHLGHRLRADQVVDPARAGVLVEDRGGSMAVVVPDTGCAWSSTRNTAVGVAVEGQADVGAGLEHPGLEVLQVLGLDRVGRVVGERAVELAEQDLEVERQALEHLGHDQPAHAVGRVGHDLQRPQGDRRRRTTARGRRTRRAGRAGSPCPGWWRYVVARVGQGLDLGQAGVLARPAWRRPGRT